ncbi:MAG: metallophosphoesterase [Thermoplasmata archaeon]
MPAPLLPDSAEQVLSLGPAEADALLSELEQTVPRRPAFVTLAESRWDRAFVFGDSHGDWRSSGEVVQRFEAGGPGAVLVGLGDYVDRPPRDCGEGSVANAIFLLSTAARHPDRVFLIQGNHETARRVGVSPHDLPDEIERLWGPRPERYSRLMGLLERGPIAVATASGAYLAHAGFPRHLGPGTWSQVFDRVDDELLFEIVWAECAESRHRRGAAEPWGPDALDQFLAASGLSIVLRGHDPDLAGKKLYGDRVVTLHTTRTYQRYGGVLVGVLPLASPLPSVSDLSIEHLSTEGRTFPWPGGSADNASR